MKSLGRTLRNWTFRRGGLVRLSLCFLLCTFSALAQSQLPDTPAPRVSPRENQPDPASLFGTISGTIVDKTGVQVPGALVKLSHEDQSSSQEMLSGEDGQFSFIQVAPGPFQLSISSAGFATQVLSGMLHSGETYAVPQITLSLATVIAEVQVILSPMELAEEQIKEQEKQRVLGVFPNFYVTYVHDAAPLSPKQKFELAWKSSVDPITFGITGVIAGVEQAQDDFNGYGQGAQGYAKRFGAAYGDAVISTYLGAALLPSLLKQDPRYFYKGTGSKRSRVLYALANSVICKGDNGHWQPNYSSIVGGLAAGGISNLYYPAEHNEAAQTFENALIGIGSTAAFNLLQEFVIKKFTPNLPSNNNPGGP